MQIFYLSMKEKQVRKELNDLMYEKIKELGYNHLFYVYPKIIFVDGLQKESLIGCYIRSSHTIFLRKELLDDALVSIRTGVFLHELAHCIDCVVNGASAHDAKFREICLKLGAEREYSYATIKEYAEKKEKASDKVKKLLALSSSDFQAESESALRKAHELMKQYALSYLEEDDKDEIFGVEIARSGRLSTYYKFLTNLICKLTGCCSIQSQACIKRIGRYCKESVLTLYGNIEQVEGAVYLYDELVRAIDQKCFSMCGKDSLEIKSGIVCGMLSKVSQMQEHALVVSSQKNTHIYCRLTGAIVTDRKFTRTASSSFNAGRSAGRSMDIPSYKASTAIKQIAC